MDAMKVAAALRWAAESCDGCSRNEVASGSGKCPDCECDECLERSSAWFNDAANAIERSALPEGVEWPRFEDGEIVRFGDKVSFGDEGGAVSSIELQDEGYFLLHVCNGAGRCSQRHFSPVERVKRPPVLAADGEPLEVGHKLFTFDNAEEYKSSDLVRRCMALAERGEQRKVEVRRGIRARAGEDGGKLCRLTTKENRLHKGLEGLRREGQR